MSKWEFNFLPNCPLRAPTMRASEMFCHALRANKGSFDFSPSQPKIFQVERTRMKRSEREKCQACLDYAWNQHIHGYGNACVRAQITMKKRAEKIEHLTGIHTTSSSAPAKTVKLITSTHAHVETHALNLQIAQTPSKKKNTKYELQRIQQNINVWLYYVEF